jgi:hypothetical protein
MDVAKVLVVNWHDKGYSAQTMYQKLQAQHAPICPAYSAITNWVRVLDRREDISMRASRSGRLPDNTIYLAIIKKLDSSPFQSVRLLASAIERSPKTIWTHSHCMGFVIRHLRFVPHTLSSIQKNERGQHSINLKNRLKSAKHRGWGCILAGDESWFYFTLDHETI